MNLKVLLFSYHTRIFALVVLYTLYYSLFLSLPFSLVYSLFLCFRLPVSLPPALSSENIPQYVKSVLLFSVFHYFSNYHQQLVYGCASTLNEHT